VPVEPRLVVHVAPVVDLRRTETGELDAATHVRDARLNRSDGVVGHLPVEARLAAGPVDVVVPIGYAGDSSIGFRAVDTERVDQVHAEERVCGELRALRDLVGVDEPPLISDEHGAGKLQTDPTTQ